MSPELFKCYINYLSDMLNNIAVIEVPVLNKINASHLLWFDDLVLMPWNPSLQKMINMFPNILLYYFVSTKSLLSTTLYFTNTA